MLSSGCRTRGSTHGPGLTREGEKTTTSRHGGEGLRHGARPWTGSKERRKDGTAGLSKGSGSMSASVVGAGRTTPVEDFHRMEVSAVVKSQGFRKGDREESKGVQAVRVEGSETPTGNRRSSKNKWGPDNPTRRLDLLSVVTSPVLVTTHISSSLFPAPLET